MGSVYEGAAIIAPQWNIDLYKDKIVVSCPPWIFCALVIALTTLFANFPCDHRPPVVSIKEANCEGRFPYLVGMLKIIASAQSRSSSVAVGTSRIAAIFSFQSLFSFIASCGAVSLIFNSLTSFAPATLPAWRPILPVENLFRLNYRRSQLILHLS